MIEENTELTNYAQHLVRLKSNAPPLAREFLTILEWQCRNFERDPDGMRPKMLWTIKKIREKSGLAPETAA